MSNAYDMLGSEIAIGDIIAYPGRVGSSLFVHMAVVLGRKENGKIKIGIVKKHDGTDGQVFIKKTSIGKLNRAIIIPLDSIRGNYVNSDYGLIVALKDYCIQIREQHVSL